MRHVTVKGYHCQKCGSTFGPPVEQMVGEELTVLVIPTIPRVSLPYCFSCCTNNPDDGPLANSEFLAKFLTEKEEFTFP